MYAFSEWFGSVVGGDPLAEFRRDFWSVKPQEAEDDLSAAIRMNWATAAPLDRASDLLISKEEASQSIRTGLRMLSAAVARGDLSAASALG